MKLRQWVESHLAFTRKKSRKLKDDSESPPPPLPCHVPARRPAAIRTSFQSPHAGGTPPKERSRIRTNPWLPSPRGSESDSSGLGSSVASLEWKSSFSSICSSASVFSKSQGVATSVRRRHSDSRLAAPSSTSTHPSTLPPPKSNSLPRDGPLQTAGLDCSSPSPDTGALDESLISEGSPSFPGSEFSFESDSIARCWKVESKIEQDEVRIETELIIRTDVPCQGLYVSTTSKGGSNLHAVETRVDSSVILEEEESSNEGHNEKLIHSDSKEYLMVIPDVLIKRLSNYTSHDEFEKVTNTNSNHHSNKSRSRMDFSPSDWSPEATLKTMKKPPVIHSPSLPTRSRVRDLINNFESLPNRNTRGMMASKIERKESLTRRLERLQSQKEQVTSTVRSLREWDLNARLDLLRVRLGILNCRRQMVALSLARCLT